MKTLKTIALVFLMLVMVASFAFSPWWLMPVNAIGLAYVCNDAFNTIALIWKPELAQYMDEE